MLEYLKEHQRMKPMAPFYDVLTSFSHFMMLSLEEGDVFEIKDDDDDDVAYFSGVQDGVKNPSPCTAPTIPTKGIKLTENSPKEKA